jgi:hypothetical protein
MCHCTNHSIKLALFFSPTVSHKLREKGEIDALFLVFPKTVNRDNIVLTATGYGLVTRDSVPDRGFRSVQTGSRAHLASYPMRNFGSSAGN